MTTVGLIGSGRIGGTVAKLAVAAGHPVILSNSRGPETLADLAAELGPLARAGTGQEAAEAGDLVVVTIPLRAFQDVPAGPLAGKVVIDTCNYYPQRDGQIPDLDSGALTSSELIQRHLAGSALVKVFNNIFFKHLESLARPSGAPDRSFLPDRGRRPGGEGGGDRVPRLHRLRGRRRGTARGGMAPAARHSRLRRAVRPVRRREGARRRAPTRCGRRWPPPAAERPARAGPPGWRSGPVDQHR